jgi:acid phosphatase
MFIRLPIIALSVSFASATTHYAADEGGLYDSLGNLSPWHVAPKASGISSELPDDCKIDQAYIVSPSSRESTSLITNMEREKMTRHGSRYPLGSELTSITGLVSTLANHTQTLSKAHLPSALSFLKSGYTSTLGVNDLTAAGRQQLFEAGVKYRLRYPHLNATSVLAGDQDRVIESAQWFAQGYFGRAWQGLNATAFSKIGENNLTVSWITPMKTCGAWKDDHKDKLFTTWGKQYLPPIAARLNKLVPGLNLSDDNVHAALYACAYDYAAHRTSPWCTAFTKEELASFEYELDLLMYGGFSYGLPEAMGSTLGSLFVSHLTEVFTNGIDPFVLEFGHDTTIDLALTALGLVHDKTPLSPEGLIPSGRVFRTSKQVPFAAQMTWEKFSCASSFEGPQVRLILNDEVLPLTTCASGHGKKYGSCGFEEFQETYKKQLAVRWGDAMWNASCVVKA